MIRIQKDISVVDAMDALLEEYAAVPQSDYKKQLRMQIRNTAMQNEGFRNEFEREVEEEFSEPPRLDEIEDMINEMSPTLAEVLDNYDVRKKAKRFAGSGDNEEGNVYWMSHQMTENQKALCEKVWAVIFDWCSTHRVCDWDMSSRLEDAYEDEKGKSCVNWRDSEDWGLRDTLPRSADYTTEGYTKDFTTWATNIIADIVVRDGATTKKAVADRIRKLYPVIRG